MSIDTHDEFGRLESLVELLLLRAIHTQNRTAYTFLEDGENPVESVTYAELAQRVLALASVLQQRFSARDRLLVLHPSSVDYMVVFFACLCADMIAVPLFPPRGSKRNERLEAVARDCEPRAALISSKQLAQVQPSLAASPELAALELFCTDTVASAEASMWRQPCIGGETIAFLQYTSGSTGHPKGVMVSHRNLLQNEKMIQQGIRSHPESNHVTWLPIYHDMGMVGNMLQPFWLGSQCVFMTPAAFLQRPIRWLHAVSRFGARVSGGPNFAFELCVDKIAEPQKEGLDFSAWEIAFTGAEPIRQATLERFSEAFAPCRFSKGAWYPCYGMAETTLAVSGSVPSSAPIYKWIDKARLTQGRIVEATKERGQPLVSSGQPLPGQIVRIVDPSTQTLSRPGCVGEIWIAGPNVARGYWGRSDLNAEHFNARIVGSHEGPFLRTGDLGFLDGRELYITGRIKDLIIVRGANHYPQDIEATVEAADRSINQAGVAAFGIYDEVGERVVVVAEVARTSLRKFDPKALALRIRQYVLEQRDILVHDVLLVRPGALPKSSSGKVQRSQCRLLYLAKNFAIAADNRASANAD